MSKHIFVGEIWSVGAASLVDLASVLRAATKKGQFLPGKSAPPDKIVEMHNYGQRLKPNVDCSECL